MAKKTTKVRVWTKEDVRTLKTLTGKRVRIYTRRGYDWTERFPRIVEAMCAHRLIAPDLFRG